MAETMATPEAALAAALEEPLVTALGELDMHLEGHGPNFPDDPNDTLFVLVLRMARALSGYTLVSDAELERLRTALERSIDAMEAVRVGLGTLDAAAIPIGAGGILRHAIREARATLTEDETDR